MRRDERALEPQAGAAQVEVSELEGPLTVSLENGTLTIAGESRGESFAVVCTNSDTK